MLHIVEDGKHSNNSDGLDRRGLFRGPAPIADWLPRKIGLENSSEGLRDLAYFLRHALVLHLYSLRAKCELLVLTAPNQIWAPLVMPEAPAVVVVDTNSKAFLTV